MCFAVGTVSIIGNLKTGLARIIHSMKVDHRTTVVDGIAHDKKR
jgi:hypothetical protein